MPPVVALVAAAGGYGVAGLGLGGALFEAGILGSFGAAILADTAIGLVTSFAINSLGSRLVEKKPNQPGAIDNGLKQVVRISDASQRIIYGRSRVGGVLAYAETSDSGTAFNGQVQSATNRFLHLVIVMAGHEIEEFESIYLNDQLVTLDSNGFVNEEPYKRGNNAFVRIQKHLGSDSQEADPLLVAEGPNWTTAHRLRGHAHLYVRLEWDPTVFVTGIPTVNAVLKGKKVYDPRSMTTGWSDNAALCIRDYLTARDGGNMPYGFGALDTEIDDDFTIAAANICDEAITKLDGSTIARYTCNGVVDTANAPLRNLDSLVSSLAGAVTSPKGKFRIYAGAYDSPEAEPIDETMLSGPIKVRDRVDIQQLFNAVRGTYISPDGGWQSTDFVPVTSALYEAQDNGERIYTDIELPYTIDGEAAQRIGKLLQRKMREQITVTMPLNYKALQFAVWDTIKLNNAKRGWSEKVFRIMSLTFGLTTGVVLQLKEENPESYDWDATDAQAEEAAPDTNLPNPFFVEQPTSVSALSGDAQLLIAGDGTIVSRILVTWDASLDTFVLNGGSTQVQFKLTTDTAWQDAPAPLGDALQTSISGVTDGMSYDIRLRFRNSIGTPSEWTQIDPHTVTGKTALPSDVTVFTISGDQLAWTEVTDLDLAGYRAKYQPGTSTSWGDAIPLHNGLLTSSPYDMVIVPVGTNTIMLKAVDTSGNESKNPAIIVTNLGDPSVANVVEEFDRKAAGWPGTLTNGTIDGTNLVADSSNLMWNTNSGASMWSANGSNPMWAAASYQQMQYVDRISVSEALAGSRMTIDATIVGDPWSIEYRENSSALMWGADDSVPTWSDDSAAMWDTPDWQPWPGEIVVGNSMYDFRLTTGQGPTQGVISEFTIIVDAPDIVERLNDVAIDPGGTRLPITAGFHVIANIQLTVQTDGGGAITARYEDKDSVLGPLVRCFDITETPVSGTLDALITGY